MSLGVYRIIVLGPVNSAIFAHEPCLDGCLTTQVRLLDDFLPSILASDLISYMVRIEQVTGR